MAAFGQPISEFNSVFLYGSDVFLVLFLGLLCFLIYRGALPPLKINKRILFLLIFLGFALPSIFLSVYPVLAVHQLTRLLLMAMLALAVGFLLKRGILKFQQIAAVIAASAFFQSLVAVLQFKFFRSLGLRLLGEPVVNVFTENIARFRIDGSMFLRSFGTLPHANILAAFLVLGLICFFYFYLRSGSQKIWYRLALAVGLFFLFLALLFTFSRSGWLVAAIVIFLIVLWGLLNKDFRKQTLSLFMILISIFYLLFSNFGWLILPRASLSTGEPSVSYRWIYNKIGLEIIKENPLGIGLGNQLFYAVEKDLYRPAGITHQRDWQPVHNIYLLIASEVGTLGLLVFLVFLFKSVKAVWKTDDKLKLITIYSLLFTSLLFGLVDHFPWTLQSGRLMFWLAIGLIMGSSLSHKYRQI